MIHGTRVHDIIDMTATQNSHDSFRGGPFIHNTETMVRVTVNPSTEREALEEEGGVRRTLDRAQHDHGES